MEHDYLHIVRVHQHFKDYATRKFIHQLVTENLRKGHPITEEDKRSRDFTLWLQSQIG
jgi:hypothetical protein